MNPNGKKFKEEWALFISSSTQKPTYNKKCNRCKNDCKQTYRAKIVCCPHYEKEDKLC